MPTKEASKPKMSFVDARKKEGFIKKGTGLSRFRSETQMRITKSFVI